MDWDKVFSVYTENIDINLKISIFEVKELNSDVQKFLDQNLISICEGKVSSSNIGIVKKRIKILFDGKNDEWKMGAIAEFFIHLYMSLTGYKQECIFFNLEENSIKKGFDGYYSFNDNQWIMESKAGSIKTKNICHKSKIKEAVNDLKDKFEGKAKNNPWKNAYNHASHRDVGTHDSIRMSIKKLSNDYTLGLFHSLEDFNIIPCATIFLDTIWCPKDKDSILKEVKEAIKNTKYKEAHLICVTQGNIDIFKHYINN